MHFRPSQWWGFLLANAISYVRAFLPALHQWGWYGFRRAFLLYSAKYAIDSFWLCFTNRKLGVSFSREFSLMNWVMSSSNYDVDREMRIFIRKCGYHYNPEGTGIGKKIQPWFYGDIKDNTRQILRRMEAKAYRNREIGRKAQAEEMKAVSRVLKNFKNFTMDETMMFFKKSTLMTMEEGEMIFGPQDKEEYFYGVVSGEIHLFGDGITSRGIELLKVADSHECIVSLTSFLLAFASGTQTYENLRIHAICGKSGKYYRVPISELVAYARSDSKKMSEVLTNALIRSFKFIIGLNDLTGILPRLHEQIFLDGKYSDISLDPGIITDPEIADEAFKSLSKVFHVNLDDRKLCWVGVIDSRTILLRRYKETKYAFYIHQGLIECTVSKLRRSYNAVQFYLTSGQIVGWREAVVGSEMTVQYQVSDGAKALIIAIPAYLVRRYFVMKPEMVIALVQKQLERYSLLWWQINYTLKYNHRMANEVVNWKVPGVRNSVETFAYLCLSGRLRFILENEVQMKRSVPQYGIIETGEWFGMVALYTDDPQLRRTVICDRCSEYVALPRYVMSLITSTFREAAGYQCDYLARSLHRDHEHTFLDTDKMLDTRFQVGSQGVHTWRTYSMICIYPTSNEIPAKIYCDELARHHTSSVTVITREDALEGLSMEEFTADTEYELAKWLVSQEEKTTILFLLGSTEFHDMWNEAIAKLSDMIQVLLTYEIPYKPSENETTILEMATKARKELVFIHPVLKVTKPQIGPQKFPHLPKGSILWLRPRPWVQRHHHVRMLDSALRYMKTKNPADLAKYTKDTKDPDKHSDYARVVRWISGQSVGLVLGGGGAKGAAHLGALRYLAELDVPVDHVGGVSIGSFLGALYALFENIDVVEGKARELWEQLKNIQRYARDFNFNPLTGIFRGHAFNWMIGYFFDDVQIEDLYIPYFCVTSDLHDNCSRTHMSGDLWFYVRASMSLTLLFPPQINQFDFHLLMDGGYSDLVPAMTMQKLGIKYLVAINIGDERLIKTFNIGYHVSGLKSFIQSYLLPHSVHTIPNHFDVWDAILYCSAKNFIQILKATDEYCIYIRPNINAYTALDFQNFEEIKTLGYLSTKFKFGGLHLKSLPVHVIWYLLRFYTYPNIAMSQAQMLQGFTDEDWEFAVNLMSKTQMFQRAQTTFLKTNLTPYMTDLMEARPYLESIMKHNELNDMNLHVPVLENFSRDDERLDLVHAIARMNDWIYMEDFVSILEGGEMGRQDFRIKTKVHAAASQTTDLENARGNRKKDETLFSDETGSSKGTKYSAKDLFAADPTMFQVLASYHNLGRRRKNHVSEELEELYKRRAELRVGYSENTKDRGGQSRGQSLPSLHSIVKGLHKTKKGDEGIRGNQPARKGQVLEEFRKCLTSADRRIDYFDNAEDKMTPIITLKQLRKSFART